MSKRRIVARMSGEMDSSVTAWLLRQQGYDVVDLSMKNWEDDDNSEYCSTRQDWIDVVSVADLIGVDTKAVNSTAEYKDRVSMGFLRECSIGRALSPDVFCNTEIKFKAFLDHTVAFGADTTATGHYACAREVNGRFELLTAFDHTRDQSYFLHCLNQVRLSRTSFPLSEMSKTKVWGIAAEVSLSNAKKKDSTGICSIDKWSFHDFLNRYLPTRPDPIKAPDGKTIGEYTSLAFYTLGQHKGIGIGDSRDGNGDAWRVTRKDMTANTLYVVQGRDHPWLLAHTTHADDLSQVAGQVPVEGTNLGAKTHYRQADAPCTVARTDDGVLTSAFLETQWAITLGQSAVLYDGEVCLGGSIISIAEPTAVGKAIA